MAPVEPTAAAHPLLQEVKPAVLPRAVLVENNRSFSWITEKICGIIEGKTPAWWWVCFILACCIASFTVAGITYLVATGVGVWGHANPVNWAWDIVNFVFWIGIGHAGTLISAILCLPRQKWRTSINRAPLRCAACTREGNDDRRVCWPLTTSRPASSAASSSDSH